MAAVKRADTRREDMAGSFVYQSAGQCQAGSPQPTIIAVGLAACKQKTSIVVDGTPGQRQPRASNVLFFLTLFS
jgi:hypothetical protein